MLVGRVMSRARRAGLLWPRSTTRLVTAPRFRKASVWVAISLGRRQWKRVRLLRPSTLLPAPAEATRPGDPLVVRRVWNSRAFVIEAGTVPRAARYVDCIVQRLPVLTPKQQLLLDMSSTESRPILYQPVAGLDVADWLLVRRCTDRFALISRCLADRGVNGRGLTYVDLACGSGWFVQAMLGLGFDARGVELDERAPQLARTFYALDPARISVDDVLTHLERSDAPADVISCLSLAHHFVVDGHPELVDLVMRRLGERSRLGFFFDMGESHEGSLAERMVGWTADHIEDRLRVANPGCDVERLGVDTDSVGAHASEFGRTLFAVWHR